ncbi:creatininase family protein [Halovenus marina]|uniref:creatininase family protein n=1 Tax=Halovenus marina TaxID=3396621 RepID=UPI003F555CD6
MYRDTDLRDVDWGAMPYREIQATGSQDGSVAVVPVGSVEQHGTHMPVATDSILVEAVTCEGAQRVSDDLPVVVTPTEWVGSSPHHMSFGGTITGSFETLLDLLEEIGECVIDNGFDAIIFVNGHGGNRSLVDSTPRILGPEYPQTDVRACTYFDLPDSEYINEIRESDHGGMAHAGEFETAMMLYLYPELVDESSMAGTMRDVDMFGDGSNTTGYADFADLSETGAAGDPASATASAGEKFFAEASERLAELLLETHERNSENDVL